ncbi:MAG: rhodanese-like domain-containing protein [Lentisphaeria bacterium]|nr:rhodanese-like domain-containing protein [Lentisphaeria bacterium]
MFAEKLQWILSSPHNVQILRNKGARICVYCRSGRRSAVAAEKLKKMGYTDVYDLGGIQEASKKLGSPILKQDR